MPETQTNGLTTAPSGDDGWELKKPIRFQCATVEASLVRRLRILAALNGQTIAQVLDSVLKTGLPPLEALAKTQRTKD